MSNNYKFCIQDAETAQKVIGWVRAGRGLRVWKSHDIGAGRPDLLMPGDVEEKPHWAYCSYDSCTLDEIEYDERNVLKIPDEFFPECERCKGSGKRTYDDLRQARKSDESNEVLRGLCNIVEVDEHHFRCTFCYGCGRTRERFKIKVKRQYWGGWEPVGGVKFGDGVWEPPVKVAKMMKRIADHYKVKLSDIKWDWGYAEDNAAEVTFYTSAPIPLSQSVLAK